MRDDQSAHYIMRILPYREPDSTVSGVLVTFVDVTSIVQAEEALVEADMRKDVFLATLSHELRNPLAPIRTAAQLLQAPAYEPNELASAQAIIVASSGPYEFVAGRSARCVAHYPRRVPLKKEYVDVTSVDRGGGGGRAVGDRCQAAHAACRDAGRSRSCWKSTRCA